MKLIGDRHPVAIPDAMCPLCGGALVAVRAKQVCSGCGRIVEGCCEGAPEGRLAVTRTSDGGTRGASSGTN